MSYSERHVVNLVSAADGSGTGYTPVITGKISTIRYVKTDYTDGVNFTITAEATGETIWAQNAVNVSTTVAPRQPTHSTAGVAALYAAGGAAVNDAICLAADRVKIVIAGAGAAKTGAFHIVLE